MAGGDGVMGVCKLDGCNGKTRGYGWCHYHRENWKKYGTPTPMCMAPGCPRGRRERPYCSRHQRNLQRYGCLERPSPLDPAPLLELVAARGGRNMVLAAAGYRYGTHAFDVQEKRLLRAAEEPHVTADMADAIAVEIFGVHPSFIWGDAWWLEVLVDVDEQPAAVAS